MTVKGVKAVKGVFEKMPKQRRSFGGATPSRKNQKGTRSDQSLLTAAFTRMRPCEENYEVRAGTAI